MDKRNQKRMEIINYLMQYQFDNLINNEDLEEIEIENYKIALDIISKLEEIDNLISLSLVNYNLNRLNNVDLAIVRYFTYEMKYIDVPIAISINEAVNITKIYSDTDDNKQHQFNNKLLDNIKLRLENDK